MPARSRDRDTLPCSASPYLLTDCHWRDVLLFLQQAQAAGRVPDNYHPEQWMLVSEVTDHGDRIEWRQQGLNPLGEFDYTSLLHRRECCRCQLPTASLRLEGLALCRPCRLKGDRQQARGYTARWRLKKTGVLPAWAAPPVACKHCGESFMPKRSTAQFCSTRCRVAAHRAK